MDLKIQNNIDIQQMKNKTILREQNLRQRLKEENQLGNLYLTVSILTTEVKGFPGLWRAKSECFPLTLTVALTTSQHCSAACDEECSILHDLHTPLPYTGNYVTSEHVTWCSFGSVVIGNSLVLNLLYAGPGLYRYGRSSAGEWTSYPDTLSLAITLWVGAISASKSCKVSTLHWPNIYDLTL